VITYLNEEVPEKESGDLRLYLEGSIVDVAPRLGRSVVFKSVRAEHEVRPSVGYDRFALTTWLHESPI
jgi:Rps23 Pro-64 3,4-dihydroxylase Tpa1-like proline 4-hydroxylase